MVNIRKRGKVYQYQFEIAKVDGKRKYISKSGFKTKNEALMAGMKVWWIYKWMNTKLLKINIKI